MMYILVVMYLSINMFAQPEFREKESSPMPKAACERMAQEIIDDEGKPDMSAYCIEVIK